MWKTNISFPVAATERVMARNYHDLVKKEDNSVFVMDCLISFFIVNKRAEPVEEPLMLTRHDKL